MKSFPASKKGIVSIMIFIMVASSMVNNVYAGDEKLFVNVGKLSGKANYTIWVGALSTAFLGATVAAVVLSLIHI